MSSKLEVNSHSSDESQIINADVYNIARFISTIHECWNGAVLKVSTADNSNNLLDLVLVETPKLILPRM